jgi:long-chain acyl-CoA synthetase
VSSATDRSVVGLFLRQVERRGAQPFLVHFAGGRWQTLTWASAGQQVLAAAGRLVAASIAPGEAVVLMAQNSVEWVIADLAIQAVGGVVAPVYPTAGPAMVRSIVHNCGARLGLADTEDRARALGVERAVRLDGEFQEWVSTSLDGATREDVGRRLAGVDSDAVATIVYTSGTTGEPKGVELTHRAITDILGSCLQAFTVGPDDRALSILPLSHVLERINGCYILIAAGGSAWLTRGPDHVLEDVAICRPTVMVCVPRVYEKMYQGVLREVRRRSPLQQRLFWWALGQGQRRAAGEASPWAGLAERLVLGGLRRRLTGGRLRYFISGGAPLLHDVEAFFWGIGVKILQGWGLTETSAGATANREDAHRYETAGQPLPGVELRIAEDGEILVRSPGTFRGYHGDPLATAAALTEDGWLRTGDTGTLDSDGYLRITDRKKDLLKTSGGKFVAPQLLEARLLQNAIVAFAIVIGDQRPYVTAVIMPAWDVVADELRIRGDPATLVEDPALRAQFQSVVDRANDGLGSWETIKRFALMPEGLTEAAGELTPTLKVRRDTVIKNRAGAIEAMYAAPRESA